MSSAEAIVNLLLDEGQEEFAFDHGVEVSPEELGRSSGVIVSPDDFIYEREQRIETKWSSVAPYDSNEPFFDSVRYVRERDADGNPRLIGTISVEHDPTSGDPIWRVEHVGEAGRSVWNDLPEKEFTSRFSATLALLNIWKENESREKPGPLTWESCS